MECTGNHSCLLSIPPACSLLFTSPPPVPSPPNPTTSSPLHPISGQPHNIASRRRSLPLPPQTIHHSHPSNNYARPDRSRDGCPGEAMVADHLGRSWNVRYIHLRYFRWY